MKVLCTVENYGKVMMFDTCAVKLILVESEEEDEAVLWVDNDRVKRGSKAEIRKVFENIVDAEKRRDVLIDIR